jgi:glycosyltransferase involved in cell wall biosynthesis
MLSNFAGGIDRFVSWPFSSQMPFGGKTYIGIKMISVCLATFNGEKFLTEQLQSILSQIGIGDELIIADDGSTDGTLEIIRSVSDARIKLLEGSPPRNPALNFERALKAAKGDFIFLSDQDDVWLPGRVEAAMKWMQLYTTVVVDCDITDDKGAVVAPSYFSIRKSANGLMHNLKKNTYLGACMSFKRELLQMALPFPEGIPMHDIWLGWVTEVAGKAKFLPEVLVHYRRHGSNVTVAPNARSRYGMFDQFRFRWWMLRKIPLVLERKRTFNRL